MDGELSLTSPSPQEDGLSIFGTTTVGVDPATAQNRAVRSHFALGAISPGIPALQDAAMTGTEDSIRQKAVADSMYNRTVQYQGMIDKVARTPGVPTQQDLDLVSGVSRLPALDPNTVIEEDYGRRFVNWNMSRNKTMYEEAQRANPYDFLDTADVTSQTVARQEIGKNLLDNLASEYSQSTWGRWGLEVGKILIPALQWGVTYNATPDAPTSGLLPGSNREDQYIHLWSLPPRETYRKLQEVVQDLRGKSLLSAIDFVQGFLAYSTSSKYLDNFFGAVDLVGIGQGLGAGVRGVRAGGRLIGELSHAGTVGSWEMRAGLRDAVVANASRVTPQSLPDVIAATGDAATAGKAAASVRLASEEIPRTSNEVARFIETLLPTSHRISILDNPGALGREISERIYRAVTKMDETIEGLVNGSRVANIQRLPEEALNIGRQKATEQVLQMVDYSHPTLNPVVDTLLHYRPETNTYHTTVRLGAVDATGFESARQASNVAEDIYGLNAGNYKIHQQGTSFYIDVEKGVDEIGASVRDAYTVGKNEQHTPGLIGAFLGKYLTPANTLSPHQVANRNLVTSASTEALRLASQISDETRLPRAQRRDFTRVIESNRATQGEWYKSIPDVEKAYLDIVGRLPSEQEVKAYFGYVRLNDLDYILRNLNIYRDKLIKGLENFSFEFKDISAGGNVAPIKFEAKLVDNLPTHGPNWNVLLYDQRTGTNQLFRKGTMTADDFERLKKLQTEGYQIAHLEDPGARPFKTMGSRDPVDFVMTRNFAREPLDWKQLPYNPGGHYDYKYKYYIKSPKIYQAEGGVHYYEGDFSLLNVSTQAQAERLAKDIEKARRLMHGEDAGGDVALAAHLQERLPWTSDQFKSFFGEGRMDPKQPIHWVESGRKLSDKIDFSKQYAGKYRDLTTNEWSLTEGTSTRFTQERSQQLSTLVQRGSETRPLYEVSPSPLIDPMTTVNRAVSSAIRDRYFKDYQVSAVESWIQQFHPILNKSIDELRQAPIYHFLNPEYQTGADWRQVQMAKTLQARTQKLLQVRDETDKALQYTKAKLANVAFNTLGQRAADWTVEALSTTRNPLNFYRGVMFHSYFGLGNWVQVLTQGAGFANIFAIAPTKAPTGLAGYYYSRLAGLNASEEVLSDIGRKAVGMGFKPGEWRESHDALMRSGFYNVSHNHSLKNTTDVQEIGSHALGKFSDVSSFFFNETERAQRVSAWHIAYKEFREANPAGKLNEYRLSDIRTRAEALTNNMSRANSSAMQEGLMSIPSQFYGYQMRLFESFYGNQLTKMEKARLLGANAALYGVGGAGAVWSGVPVYDFLKKYMLEKGMTGGNSDQNPWLDGLMEGGVAAAINYATNGEIKPNIAQKLGPSGLKPLFDVIAGDKTLMEVAGGAAAGYGGKFWKGVVGVSDAALDMLSGKPGASSAFWRNAADASRVVSTSNNIQNLWEALNTGKAISTSGLNLGELSAPQAWFRAITGLNMRHLTDATIGQLSVQNWNEYRDKVKKEATEYFRKASEATLNGDSTTADYYNGKFREALTKGGIAGEEWTSIINDAMKNTDMSRRWQENYWRQGPFTDRERRFDNFNRKP